MLTESEYNNRYASGEYRFVDVESGFQLVTAGMIDNTPAAREALAPRVAAALDMIARMERGEVVNATADAATSENRAVDHYNLRMVDSPVEGKSLADSLKIWEETQQLIRPVVEGTRVAPCGRRYTAVIMNGIGGSYLGPLMYLLSQRGDLYNHMLPVKIFFVANTDPETIRGVLNAVDIETSIMVTVSKSGSTQETAGNTKVWNAALTEAGITDVAPHSIAVTTPNSALDKMARGANWLGVLNMNTETGGRTSICSAVGGVVAAVAGLDFAAFLRGMSHMDALTRRADPAQNPAMTVALAIEAQRLASNDARRNMIVLAYSDVMREFAHYLQQLYMESIGKEITVSGAPQREGLTVFGGVGTGEQHAFMQQVQKGIDDAFVRFMHFRERAADYTIPDAGSVGRQLLAFVKGTEQALRGNGRSFMTASYARHDSFNIGMAVALEERIVSILAAMRDLNAYDQPGVQDGKLAASAVNKVSAKVAAAVAAKPMGATFAAQEVAAEVDGGLDIVESILLDMAANADLAGTGYGAKLACEYDGAKWVFTRD